jgi:hypothetical protein
MFWFIRDKISERKLELISCGICRRAWEYMSDPRSQEALFVCERWADGIADFREVGVKLKDAEKAARHAARFEQHARHAESAAGVATLAVDRLSLKRDTPNVQKALKQAEEAARRADERAAEARRRANELRLQQEASRAAHLCILALWSRRPGNLYPLSETYVMQVLEEMAPTANVERQKQCAILRDICGTLAPLPAMKPAWHSSNVRGLSQGIYEGYLFDRLPILADALEDAGCDNADILNHCRQPGEHVRGCWVVDLLLGKE